MAAKGCEIESFSGALLKEFAITILGNKNGI
jgi:hypothetical protein